MPTTLTIDDLIAQSRRILRHLAERGHFPPSALRGAQQRLDDVQATRNRRGARRAFADLLEVARGLPAEDQRVLLEAGIVLGAPEGVENPTRLLGLAQIRSVAEYRHLFQMLESGADSKLTDAERAHVESLLAAYARARSEFAGPRSDRGRENP